MVVPNTLSRTLSQICDGLKVGETLFKRRRYQVMGEWLYLAAVRLEDDLLIVGCDDKPRTGLVYYGLRWGIETFFGNVKTRGFCLEQTHMTDPEKLSMLLGLLALATVWCLRVGEAIELKGKKRQRKSHGRFERSLFRVGLDFLQGLVFESALEKRRSQFVFRVLSCT